MRIETSSSSKVGLFVA